MPISPDAFVTLVSAEIARYQDPTPYDSTRGNGRISQHPAEKDDTPGFTGGAQAIRLEGSPYWSEVLGPDVLFVGVDYKLELSRDTFDQSQALANANPRGVVRYEILRSSSFAFLTFDLERERVATATLSKEASRNGMRSDLEGMPLEEGVRVFFEDVYRGRGVPLRQ